MSAKKKKKKKMSPMFTGYLICEMILQKTVVRFKVKMLKLCKCHRLLSMHPQKMGKSLCVREKSIPFLVEYDMSAGKKDTNQEILRS